MTMTPEQELEARLADAETGRKAREMALKLAVQHVGPRTDRYTTDPTKIVALADAFYGFLTRR